MNDKEHNVRQKRNMGMSI